MSSPPSSWPWVSLVIAVAVTASPWGTAFLSNALFSGEALSRDIARPIVFGAAAVMLLAVLGEFALRRFLRSSVSTDDG